MSNGKAQTNTTMANRNIYFRKLEFDILRRSMILPKAFAFRNAFTMCIHDSDILSTSFGTHRYWKSSERAAFVVHIFFSSKFAQGKIVGKKQRLREMMDESFRREGIFLIQTKVDLEKFLRFAGT